jgi:hypothetical protein
LLGRPQGAAPAGCPFCIFFRAFLLSKSPMVNRSKLLAINGFIEEIRVWCIQARVLRKKMATELKTVNQTQKVSSNAPTKKIWLTYCLEMVDFKLFCILSALFASNLTERAPSKLSFPDTTSTVPNLPQLRFDS